jgi:hypothetical protein
MSLLRLLTAGKSLVGLKKSEKRYHLPSEKSFPTFGSKKNPFRGTIVPEGVEPGRESAKPVEESGSNEGRAGKAGPPGAGPVGVEGQAQTGVFVTRKPQSEGEINGQSKRAEQAGARRSAVKALLLWGRAKTAKRANLPGGSPMVQGELSLDKVKVVRNDLSETDLEVVRRGDTADSKRAEPPVFAEPNSAASDSGWGAAAGRLLGIGKM